MARVQVIDDSEIERLGRAAILERLGHDVEARAWADLTGSDGESRAPSEPVAPEADLVLAVLRPDAGGWDRYAAVGVLARIRSQQGRRGRLVAALSPLAMANPLLRLRLERAAVTEVIDWSAVDDAAALDAIVARRLRTRAPAPSPMDLALVGVGPCCDPDRLVSEILEWARTEPAVLRAFEPGTLQNQCGLSRRQAHRLRARLAEAGAVRSMGAGGGGPARDRTLPRWSEVIAVANLCRGWEPPGPGLQELPGFGERRMGEVAFA